MTYWVKAVELGRKKTYQNLFRLTQNTKFRALKNVRKVQDVQSFHLQLFTF